MMTWLAANLGTILVSLILAGIVALAIRSLIKDKKQGKSSCGCNCSHCAMGGSCHQKRSTGGPGDGFEGRVKKMI